MFNQERHDIVQEIREALETRIAQLREVTGRCETCPDGPCEYCELRGCLALLERSQERGNQ